MQTLILLANKNLEDVDKFNVNLGARVCRSWTAKKFGIFYGVSIIYICFAEVPILAV